MPLTDCCKGNNRGVCRQAQKHPHFVLGKRRPEIGLRIVFNTTNSTKLQTAHAAIVKPYVL